MTRSLPRSVFDQQYVEIDDRPTGFGGYGTVFKYRQRASGEVVAIKVVIPPATREDPEALLMREIGILRDLSHPNIIAIKDPALYHELDRHGRDVYRFVLECMDEELYEYLHDPQHRHPRPLTSQVLRGLRPQRLPVEEVKDIVYQIALGVQYCHSKNVIHRDIKLENIMRQVSSGRVKLIDFGLARVLEGLGDVTSRIGSRRYMAPEVMDLRARYTLKADVWSLGVTTFLLLARRYPFPDDPHSGYPLTDRLQSAQADCFGDQDGQLALELVRGMLQVHQADRLAIGDVLAHPWLASQRAAHAAIESEPSQGAARTDELLLHLHRGRGTQPLKIYLSKLNLVEVQDRNAAVIVSSFRDNVKITPDEAPSEGSPSCQPGTWVINDETLNPGGKKGSLGRMVQRLQIPEGTALRTKSYGDILCEIEHGRGGGEQGDSSADLFRSLWLVMLQGRHQGRDFVWSTYSALRHHLNHIAASPGTHIIMSLVGCEKRGPDGQLHSQDKLRRLVQSVVQEVAGLASEAARLVPPDHLDKITVVVWEELFDLVREGFRLCGRSDTLSVLNDPHYLGSLTAAIRRTYALPGCASALGPAPNPVLASYIDCLQQLPPPEDNNSTTGGGSSSSSSTSSSSSSPLCSSALQICYWGGRIGRHLRGICSLPASAAAAAAEDAGPCSGGAGAGSSSSSEPSTVVPMDVASPSHHPTPPLAPLAPPPAPVPARGAAAPARGDTFIVDSIHALEILERNQAKAEEERWMGLLTPFDAAATLQCVKFLLQQVATGALPLTNGHHSSTPAQR